MALACSLFLVWSKAKLNFCTSLHEEQIHCTLQLQLKNIKLIQLYCISLQVMWKQTVSFYNFALYHTVIHVFWTALNHLS